MEKLIWRCSFDYKIFKSEIAGCKFVAGDLQLDIMYKQPLTYIVYYGQLQYSGITDYSIYDFIIANDISSVAQVTKCRLAGCKVIQYKAFGSVFEDTEAWLAAFKVVIKGYKDDGFADGIFFDECEVGYWDLNYYTQPDKCFTFQTALQELCDYCRDIGLITVVNGVRAFAQLGDYFLWESFAGYWNTNRLNFDNVGAGARTVSADGAITYALNFNEWTLTGDLAVSGGKMTGSTGTMQLDIKMEDYLISGDQLSTYDWVYFEWKGEGANDSTLEIYASYGDVWPYDGTWIDMPKLYSGSPAVWNGINVTAKYLRLRMEFTGASLSMNNCIMFFGYLYPYYNMTASNGAADTNTQYWNYNNAQLAYILDKMSRYNNDPNNHMPCRVLAHCYGEVTDEAKAEYMFCLANMLEFSGWDFTHPLHQFIKYTDILDNPFGMLLSRVDNGDGSYSATFTGCSLVIDTANNTYTLTRTEPTYWYDRAITCDGTMTDWAAISNAYENSNPATLDIYLREITQDFASGNFDNVYIHDDGYITLIDTGFDGTWTSAETTAIGSRLSQLQNIVFGVAGDITIQIRYKRADDSWSGYYTYAYNESGIEEEFKVLQIKLTFTAGGWVTCWAYSLYYQIELLEPLNLRNIKMADDNSYIYVYAKFNAVIDMDTHVYNLYFYTEDTADYGFIGDWWETSFGAHFYIYNTSLYRWNDNSDRTDPNGFQFLGHVFSYELSTDGKEIEYKIKKSIMGRIQVEELKAYMLLSEATTNYAALIQPSGVDTSTWPITFSGEMLYTQTQYNNYCPHGYYKSEEVYINIANAGVKLTFTPTTPANTAIKVYLRYKKYNVNWSAWVEIDSGDSIAFKIQAIQYCVSLTTTDKAATPSITDIEIEVL